jgi:RNA polymerase sigma factor (sigma-70 family)
MAGGEWTMDEQDRFLAETIRREEPRLRGFIRKRVMDTSDAEDVLQDVFYELVNTYRMMKPVEQAGAWMFRVARNRITDLFRRRKAVSLSEPVGEEDGLQLEELLPSPDAGPDALYARGVIFEALEEALAELPVSQREAFVAHEMEGVSFAEMSEKTGVGVNTLLSHKRRAVLHLRKRLAEMQESFGTAEGEGQ